MRNTEPRNDCPENGHRRLLAVADVQTGFHHSSISQALATLQRIGRDTNEFSTEIRTDSQLITRSPILGKGAKYGGRSVNARNLDDFDALFLLPSGAGTLSAAQRADLLAFVRDDGKGLVAGHAATTGFFDWPEFGELLGGRMAGEFDGRVRVVVEDAAFPGARAFGLPSFEFEEQHLVLTAPYIREECEVVLRLDPQSLTPEQLAMREDGDFPVVWTRTFGRGRVCNISWGHYEETWDDPRFQELVLGAVRWAFGANPRPK